MVNGHRVSQIPRLACINTSLLQIGEPLLALKRVRVGIVYDSRMSG